MVESKGTITMHAVLVKVSDSGVLITGESGTGKSETALGLLAKCHSLVADDVVEIRRTSEGLIGTSPYRLRRLVNIRDIGILDVSEVYGDQAFTAEHKIDVAIELVRLPLKASIAEQISWADILGIKIPKYTLNSDKTRDLALLIETVVKLLNKPAAIKTIDSI